jgi:pilus assembly protein CpaB
VGRRSRGLALLGAAAACAGIAASSVNRYTNDVHAQVGPLAPVLQANAHLRAGTPITADTAARRFDVQRVPVRYVPPGALASPSEAVGYRLAVQLEPRDYVTARSLLAGSAERNGADPGGRTVEVAVAGAASLGDSLQPGTHVDVLITTDRGSGPGRTYVALQDAELVAFSAGAAGAGGSADAGRATAALRVSLRQAVLLTAAQNFARELRLVPRPAGDHRRLGAVGVSAAALGG